jgi:hypothetical protein
MQLPIRSLVLLLCCGALLSRAAHAQIIVFTEKSGTVTEIPSNYKPDNSILVTDTSGKEHAVSESTIQTIYPYGSASSADFSPEDVSSFAVFSLTSQPNYRWEEHAKKTKEPYISVLIPWHRIACLKFDKENLGSLPTTVQFNDGAPDMRAYAFNLKVNGKVGLERLGQTDHSWTYKNLGEVRLTHQKMTTYSLSKKSPISAIVSDKFGSTHRLEDVRISGGAVSLDRKGKKVVLPLMQIWSIVLGAKDNENSVSHREVYSCDVKLKSGATETFRWTVVHFCIIGKEGALYKVFPADFVRKIEFAD